MLTAVNTESDRVGRLSTDLSRKTSPVVVAGDGVSSGTRKQAGDGSSVIAFCLVVTLLLVDGGGPGVLGSVVRVGGCLSCRMCLGIGGAAPTRGRVLVGAAGGGSLDQQSAALAGVVIGSFR